MRRKGIYLVASLALLGLGACSQQSTQQRSKPALQQATNKGFQLTGINGKTYSLADFKGKKVYLKFWASWCSICLASLGDTDQLAKEEKDDQVILSVVVPNHRGEKSEADFKKWYQGLDYQHLPVLLDSDGSLAEGYGVSAYPTQVFFDSKGKLAKKQVGFMDKEAIQEELNSLK